MGNGIKYSPEFGSAFGFYRLLLKQRLNVLNFANPERQVSVCFELRWLFCNMGTSGGKK